jgi:hypothetical protein
MRQFKVENASRINGYPNLGSPPDQSTEGALHDSASFAGQK